jgi:septal ring factor EnvC (AmiA/AmiB activator)
MEHARKRAETEALKSPSQGKKPNLDETDRTFSQNFASQRGKLPMPLTGTSIIVSRYGEYDVKGLRGVTLDNKGIDIQGQPGAHARAVFDGKVATIFTLNGLLNILIRHGNYISVYCNLSSTSVKQGDDVKAEQTIGRIFSDHADNNRTILHFQLRVEKEKLNPELWLK